MHQKIISGHMTEKYEYCAITEHWNTEWIIERLRTIIESLSTKLHKLTNFHYAINIQLSGIYPSACFFYNMKLKRTN